MNGEGQRKLDKRLAAFSAAWARLQADTPGWPTAKEDKVLYQHLMPWLKFHEAMLIGELVVETLRFLRNNPGSPAATRYGHVLVDEYQGLNKAEQVLLDLISRSGSLTVIGDEDQSVYSFKYAHPQGISGFDQDHPGTHDESLTECRRCPRLVVSMANELICHNEQRSRRILSARRRNPDGEVYLVQWADMQSEAQGLSAFIKGRIDSKSVNPGDILVLAPRRQFGYGIRESLNRAGVAAHSFFHEQVLDGNPKRSGDFAAQEAFTLLTLLARPTDRVALRCWLGFGSSSLIKPAWTRLRDHCEKTNLTPQQALNMMVTGDLSVPYTQPLMGRYRELVEAQERLQRSAGQQLIDSIFPAAADWAGPIRDMAVSIGDDEGPKELLELLQRSITQPELPTDVDYVRVMSLHKSKGLTAQMVVVCGFIDGLIPTVDVELPLPAQQADLEEQRRLFYVAMTRTTFTLVLSSVATLEGALAYRIGASVRSRGVVVPTVTSQFADELGPRPDVLGGEEFLKVAGPRAAAPSR